MARNKFLVKPVSSASNEALVKNLTTNMDNIDTWVERCKKVNTHAWIISAGPSTKRFLRDYKKLLEKPDQVIFCIKHALPMLKEAGVVPDFCVVLDPRGIDDTSTLGKTRRDLYSCAPEETTFFVASMTNPTVPEYLKKEGHRIIGWHALTPEMQLLPDEYKKRLGGLLITGGTSSGTRTVELAFYMGITRVTCVGFDSSFDGPKPTNIKDSPEPGKGKQRYLRVNVDDNYYYTTGELVAQAQDFERLVTNEKHPSDVRVFDCGIETSLTSGILSKVGNKTWRTKTWKNLIA